MQEAALKGALALNSISLSLPPLPQVKVMDCKLGSGLRPVASRLLAGQPSGQAGGQSVPSSTVTPANSEASCPSTPGLQDGSAALTES